ncbi:MAG: hypothetical protein JJ879_14000, partial [Sneathiella sp.]|nr:hypothetical protein [Sneathiella sp.]
MMGNKLLKALLISSALVLQAPFAFAADKVDVRAGEHPKYGRIVLDWGKTVPYKAVLEGGYLVVNFDQPFEADIALVPRILDGYVSSATLSDDQKTVRFALKGDFDLKQAKYGTALSFDLLKKNTSGAQSKVTGPTVPVRVGEHEDYTRIVFDWPAKTDYSVSGNGQEHSVSFGRSGNMQLAPLQRNLPRWVSAITQTASDGQSKVDLSTTAPSKIKSFLSGNSVVIDILKDDSAPVVAKAADKPEAAPDVKPSTPVKKLTDNVPTLTEVKEAEQSVSGETVSAGEGLRADEKIEEPAAVQQPGPKSLIPVANQKSEEPIQEPSNSLTVNVGNLKDGFRMIFPWEKAAAMALFERNGVYWLVFNEPVKLDFSRLSGPYKFLLVRKQQIPHPTATIARLTVREGYTPSVARTENEWKIDFRLGEAPRIANSIDIQPQPASAQGARVFIPAVNNGNQITFTDPEAGDQLISVPLYAPSWGLGARRTFAQFVVLPSMQGIGMYTRDSSVNVAVERNGVSVTADDGLQLVREISKDDLFASGDQTDRFSQKRDNAQLVKLDEWAQVTPKEFWERKQILQQRVARAPQGGRNAARMGLAKYFVAHKYFADAFGVLERIRKDDPRADEDGMYRLLRGLANLGLHHIEEAEQDLMNPVFTGIAEVAPWRAKVAAAKGDWKTAAQEMKLGQEALGVYSVEYQNQFNLIQAQAALEDFDVEAAQKPLERIKTSLEQGNSKEVIARREFLEGLAALKTGEIDRAIGKFDQVIEIDYRPLTTEARYRRVNARLAKEEITPDEAIEELRLMSYAWRGDDLELNILKRIGDLQIAKGDIREGLKTLREIVMTFPKHPKSRDIAREMNDIFNQLFLEGKAEDMPPVKALALYYEYRELT